MKTWMYALIAFLLGTTNLGAAPTDVVFLNVCVNSTIVKAGFDDDWTTEAQAMGRAVRENVGKLYPLTSASCFGRSAKKKAVLSGFQWLKSTVGGNSLAIVYLGAHGGVWQGEYYLSLADGYLSATEIKEAMEGMNCRVILILDTCRSGAILDNWKESKNTLIYATCKSTESAYCWGWVPHFCYAMTGADYNEDGYVDTDEVHRYISMCTPNNRIPQTPVVLPKFNVNLAKIQEPYLISECQGFLKNWLYTVPQQLEVIYEQSCIGMCFFRTVGFWRYVAVKAERNKGCSFLRSQQYRPADASLCSQNHSSRPAHCDSNQEGFGWKGDPCWSQGSQVYGTGIELHEHSYCSV
jgi:hypothetical protein